MSGSNSSTRSCPYGFDNVNIKNILLIILTLKTIWNTFKNSSPEVNIEELLMSKMGEHMIHIPTPIPPPIPQHSINFSLTKLLLLAGFVYLIFYIRDYFESLSCCKIEGKICPEECCKIGKCPFNFEKKSN